MALPIKFTELLQVCIKIYNPGLKLGRFAE